MGVRGNDTICSPFTWTRAGKTGMCLVRGDKEAKTQRLCVFMHLHSQVWKVKAVFKIKNRHQDRKRKKKTRQSSITAHGGANLLMKDVILGLSTSYYILTQNTLMPGVNYGRLS